MKLFIAEKPSLAQAIAAGIGVGKKFDGYISLNGGKEIVTWCYGHILAQLNPDEYAEKYRSWRMEDLPIIPSLWKLKVKPDAAKQFRIVRELISKATTIVNAGDPDREGQLLVDEVLDYVGNKKPVQRILLNALDEKSVKQSLKDLRDNHEFEGMKNAALGRSRADWLIGMNLSRAYTIRARQVGYESVSVGRVMTPTMALVVRREEEIAKFKPVTHYAVKAIFRNNFGEIPTTWQMSDNILSLDSEGRLLDKKVAEDFLVRLNALVGRQGKIIRVEEKKKTENQRLPYSLSTLQIEAGKRYGYSPQTVLDTMQMLYEKKLTTYPRSDCEYLPENQFADSKEILGHLKELPNFSELVKNADMSIHSKAWNDKKISAHHAIIPTRIKADFEKLNAVEQNLYVMVSQAYLAQFYPEHEYKATTVIISFADEKFIGKGKLVTKVGWKAIYKNVAKSESEEAESILSPVRENESVKYVSGKIAEKTTKPPARFTPSTLLQAMKEIYRYVKDDALKAELKECSGIGTEATRAGIIEKLQDNGFLELAGKFFAPTEKARMAVKILPDEMIYPDTTALWEKELEEVAAGKESFEQFYQSQLSGLSTLLDKAKTVRITPSAGTVLCPNCGKAMIRRKGKNGFFWGCSNYPECKTTARDDKGKPDFTASTRKISRPHFVKQ
ncbi:MAG: DNA topoisomerase III [Selenomonadaceae bacterium]|nr:DNA topoisomerase III [Selenomonadaceae bacterium]